MQHLHEMDHLRHLLRKSNPQLHSHLSATTLTRHSERVSTTLSPRIKPQSPQTKSPFPNSSTMFGSGFLQLRQISLTAMLGTKAAPYCRHVSHYHWKGVKRTPPAFPAGDAIVSEQVTSWTVSASPYERYESEKGGRIVMKCIWHTHGRVERSRINGRTLVITSIERVLFG
jgi:hypothetical protein